MIVFGLFYKKMLEMLLLHGSAKLLTSVHSTEAITESCLRVLPHPPWCLDLALSDFHPFGHLKVSLYGHRYRDDEALQTALHQCLWRKERNF